MMGRDGVCWPSNFFNQAPLRCVVDPKAFLVEVSTFPGRLASARPADAAKNLGTDVFRRSQRAQIALLSALKSWP